LLWPLRLMPVRGSEGRHAKPWQLLADMGEASPWREVVDEYTGDSGRFQERHYNEFVTFLPYVQRFCTVRGAARAADHQPRCCVPARGQPQSGWHACGGALAVDVVHTTSFFLDVDVVFSTSNKTNDLPLPGTRGVYRFGRGYPASWNAAGQAQHCLSSAEWLGHDGQVLAQSDASQRELFMAHVSSHRAPRIAAHWAWLLEPLVGDHSDRPGVLRYRQIEYYRMPQLNYLALDNPQALSRSDFIRLGLVTGAPESGPNGPLPYAEPHLADFEKTFCYDRFWSDGGAAPHTRYLCSGHAMVVVGDAQFTLPRAWRTGSSGALCS
jgi:hypothetical protein